MMDFFATINVLYVFIGAILLCATGGFLGSFAVLRRQGLLGDALAHSALPGIGIAFLVMESKFLPGLLLGALISGLCGAAVMYFLVYSSKIKMDSAMAAVLSMFFGLGIVVLTYIQDLPLAAQSGLESFLFGQAAGLVFEDVVWIGAVGFAALVLVLLFWKELKLCIFDRDFARSLRLPVKLVDFVFMTLFVTAILISLKTVGVILTAGIFITPAASALLVFRKLSLVTAFAALVGGISGGLGVYFSASFNNLPTGPSIVLFASLFFILIFLLAPKNGLIVKMWARRRQAFRMEWENALKLKVKSEKLKVSSKISRFLVCRGFVDQSGGLTKAGKREAVKIVEKHRLWECYLAQRLNLADDHVHREAEEMEHFLDDEMVKELKRVLGNPKFDPHGEPIKLKL